MLSNIFDPSLVIGNAYRARIVSTADGRVLTGLLVEDSPQRVVLKLQGGKIETIARADVEEMEISKLSLMPEGVETQYKPEEIIDLFAFLKLDKSPADPAAKVLPGFGELPSRK
jgi:putative heme-binding domain-containing protein